MKTERLFCEQDVVLINTLLGLLFIYILLRLFVSDSFWLLAIGLLIGLSL